MKKFIKHVQRFVISIWKDITPDPISEMFKTLGFAFLLSILLSLIMVAVSWLNIWFFNLYGLGMDYHKDFAAGVGLFCIEFFMAVFMLYLVEKWKATSEKESK